VLEVQKFKAYDITVKAFSTSELVILTLINEL
jgi:hypothetical protein